jgi:hypothetical protein
MYRNPGTPPSAGARAVRAMAPRARIAVATGLAALLALSLTAYRQARASAADCGRSGPDPSA